MTPLATEAQVAVSFKEAYKECYRIFKEQVAQLSSSFAKRVQWMRDQLYTIIGWEGHKYSNIICEYLFIESRFTKNRGYITSENSFISHVMWMKVWMIQQEYYHLNSRKNFNSLVNSIKFNYLKSIEPKAKN